MLINKSSRIASIAMLKRVRLMARFIHDHHLEEFSAWWGEHYEGKAQPEEFVNYWVHNDLENTLVLGRKTRI